MKKIYNILLCAALILGTSIISKADPTQANTSYISAVEDYDPTTAFLVIDDNYSDFMAPNADEIISYAERYLGRPYRHGSKGPNAFDCSGFTSFVFKNFGYNLSPSSRTQYTQGESIATSDIRPGDLLFFSSRSSGRGNVGHVGMAVNVDDATGAVTFIHASISGVKYNTYPSDPYYKAHFIGARRVLNQ